MRRGGAKRDKSKKINKMNVKELTNLIKDLEAGNHTESKVYSAAVKQLSVK